MKSCVFFDRDGIVNESPGVGYVERWEDFRLLPGFPRVLELVRACGMHAVVVTNQRGVARGLMSEEELKRIHKNLQELLQTEHGLALLDIVYCPHEKGVCDCRKPQPGMLLKAAKRHDIDLASSWMVGDSERDIEAGHRAGCRTVLVGSTEYESAADYRVVDLTALHDLLKRELTC